MTPRFLHAVVRGSLAAAISLASTPVLSSNGLNLVGFGAESLGLGSADIALARDANAVNINPAGVSQIQHVRADGYLVPFYSFNLKHSDAYNDDYGSDNPFGAFISAAYAQQALHPKLRVGLGVFASGGTGLNYDELATPFGTRDAYSAVLAITKLATGLAWEVDEQLSLGLGLNLTYAATRQKVFPDTSSAGADADSAADDFYGLRIDGFALAQELGAGLAWQVSPRWLFAAELTWLDWSRALRDATLTARQPNDAAAPAQIAFAQALDHRDQYVVGLGLEYRLSPRTVLRGGVNIAPNPMPNRTLTPTLNLTADGELAAGFAHTLTGGWEIATTMQLQGPKKERYNNPQQPFGPATEDYGVVAFTVQLSRSW